MKKKPYSMLPALKELADYAKENPAEFAGSTLFLLTLFVGLYAVLWLNN